MTKMKNYVNRSCDRHPVAMSVMHNGTFCTTTIVKKRAGIGCACTHDHFRSHHFRVRAASNDVISGSTTSPDIAQLPVAHARTPPF
jgi:hypothetical protein